MTGIEVFGKPEVKRAVLILIKAGVTIEMLNFAWPHIVKALSVECLADLTNVE